MTAERSGGGPGVDRPPVIVERVGAGAVRFVLDRPCHGNASTHRTRCLLADLLEDLDRDRAVRATILCGRAR